MRIRVTTPIQMQDAGAVRVYDAGWEGDMNVSLATSLVLEGLAEPAEQQAAAWGAPENKAPTRRRRA